MKKANVEGLEQMASGYLQYLYRKYLHTRIHNCEKELQEYTFAYYDGACKMVEAIGGDWHREYSGDESAGAANDINNYSHWVHFPSDVECSKLNFKAWED